MAVERLDAAQATQAQARVAGYLQGRGVAPGERVAFLCGSSAALLNAALGCLRAGVVPVLLNPALTPSERSFVLGDCGPTLVVDSEVALARLFEGPSGELAAWPLARAMHYTSGTTGRPKGVWSGLLDEDQAERLHADEAEQWGFGPGDVLLVCSPLHHSAPLRFSSAVMGSGGSVVVMDRFEAGTVVEVLGSAGISTAFMVPAHLQRLFHADGGTPAIESADLSRFRLLAHAGAPCPPSLKRRAMEVFPPGSVWEFYGSTEGQFSVCGPEEWLDRPGTVGRARPGRRLEVSESGVIWCAPPDFAHFTYWADEERTRAAWSRGADGRPQFTVGDLGRLDPDGYLFLEGRREDLIISGGVNVYPAEVEAVLSEAPGVVEVAVFGVDDERWGQRVCAALVGEVDPGELRRLAEARLAAYKRPKDLFVVEDLPRTSTGKVRRLAIAAQLGLV